MRRPNSRPTLRIGLGSSKMWKLRTLPAFFGLSILGVYNSRCSETRALTMFTSPTRMPGKIKATTFEDWNGVLKLTDRWMFHSYFNHAVEKISELPIDPIKKIQLMHKHKIRREWAIDAFVALALRDTFPDQEDTEVLGLELTTCLAKARERVSYMNPFWNRRRYEPVKVVVCEVFRLNSGLKDPESWKAV
jgi:hypothetical protein